MKAISKASDIGGLTTVREGSQWWPYAGPHMSADECLERAIWHDGRGEDELCAFYLDEAVRFEIHATEEGNA